MKTPEQIANILDGAEFEDHAINKSSIGNRVWLTIYDIETFNELTFAPEKLIKLCEDILAKVKDSP